MYPHSTPDYFAEFAVQAVDARSADRGRLLRDHAGADRGRPRGVRRRPRRRARSIEVDEPELALAPAAATRRRRVSNARSATGEWVVSVELDPPKGGSLDGLVEIARAIQASGHVGFVDVNDNPMARARMNALMTSATLQREAGIETIPHVTPRDTTVMGLEGVLLGAHAEGVRNILAVTGDPPHVGDYPGSRGVYEVDSIGLVQLLSALNRGEDYVGKGIDAPTSFFVGVAVNPSADDLELELERFRRKIDAGAHFAMTQALFDVELLDRFAERLGGAWPVPVLVGVWPLRSHAMALRLHNEVPGISVPGDRARSALRDAGAGRARGRPRARARARRRRSRARRGDLRDPPVQAAARGARPVRLTPRHAWKPPRGALPSGHAFGGRARWIDPMTLRQARPTREWPRDGRARRPTAAIRARTTTRTPRARATS